MMGFMALFSLAATAHLIPNLSQPPQPNAVFTSPLHPIPVHTATTDKSSTSRASEQQAMLHTRHLSRQPQNGQGWIRPWLEHLSYTFTIPPIQKFGFIFTLDGPTCTQFDLGDVDSVYTPPLSIVSGLDDFTFNCSGLWTIATVLKPKQPKYSGALVGDLGDAGVNWTSVVGTYQNDTSLPILPDDIRVPRCNATINITQLLTGLPVDANISQLLPFVDAAASTAICSALTTVLETNVTNVLHKLRKFLLPLLTPPDVDVPPPITPDHYVDFTSVTKLLSYILKPRALRPVVLALTNDTGSITITLPKKNKSAVASLSSSPAASSPPTSPASSSSSSSSSAAEDTQQLVSQLTHRLEDTLEDLLQSSIGAAVNVSLRSLSLSGLDTISTLEFSTPFNQSIGLSLGLDKLGVAVALDLSVTSDQGVLSEQVTLQLELDDLVFILETQVAVEVGILHDIRVSQLDLKCLLSAMTSLYITNITLTSQLRDLSVHGLDGDDQGIDDLLNAPLQLLATEFSPALSAAVNHVVGDQVRTLLNLVFKFMTKPTPADACPPPVFPAPANVIDFRTNKLVGLARSVLNHRNQATGELAVNAITGSWAVPGGIRFPGDVFNWTISNTSVVLSNLLLNGLDTFDMLSIFMSDPSDGVILNNAFSMSHLRPSNTSYRLNVGGNVTDVLMETSDVAVVVDARIKLNTAPIMDLTLNQTGRLSCLLQALQELQLDNLKLDFGKLMLFIKELGEFKKIGEVDNIDLDHQLAGLIKLMVNHVGSEALRRASYQCHGLPAPTPAPTPVDFVDSDFAHYFGGVAVALAATSAGLAMICFVRKTPDAAAHRQKVSDAAARKLSDANVNADYDAPLLGIPRKADGPSLLFDQRVHWSLRYGIPFLIAVSIGTFIYAHTGVGAAVGVQIAQGETVLVHLEVFDFSLGNSIRDMWTAEVFALSLLIAVFSGAWPYGKLLLLLACWVLPPRIMNPERRERALILLDALGKWSLVDAYVLVMMMVAFRLHIALGGMNIDILVTPYRGFYGFLVAAMISLVLSHGMLNIHRFTEGTDPSHIPEGGERKSLAAATTCEDADGNAIPERSVNGSLYKGLVTFALLASVLLFAVGDFITTFGFQFQGAAALLLDDVDTDYSLVSLGNALPRSTANANQFGIRWIQATYLTLAMAMPLAYTLMCLLLWLWPMTTKAQSWTYVMCEVVLAWNTIEVFLSSVLAAIFEIETFAAFTVGTNCDFVNPILEVLLGESKCFAVGAYLDNGMPILFTGAVLSAVAGQMVMRGGHKSLEARIALRHKQAQGGTLPNVV